VSWRRCSAQRRAPDESGHRAIPAAMHMPPGARSRVAAGRCRQDAYPSMPPGRQPWRFARTGNNRSNGSPPAAVPAATPAPVLQEATMDEHFV
jgi:hypothetical protein